MSVNISALVKLNQRRWDVAKLKAARVINFDQIAARLCRADGKFRYQALEKATGVPWAIIAVIHEREASGRWDRQLAQGDLLIKKSTHDPIGLGPFLVHPGDVPGNDNWHRAGLVALIDAAPHAAKWKDWTPGGAMTLLEEFNGLGYAAMGVPSAYVWSGTDQYVSGKYVADHVYRKNVVDVQEGCAPLLMRMMLIDKSIVFAKAP